MTPTTIGALLDTLDTLVLDLVPSVAELRARGWSRVADIDNVPGGEIRTFFIEASEPVPILDGIYSPSAIEHGTTVRVWTSYKNLRRRQKQALAGEDSRQIWIDWDVRRDPIVDGLISVENAGFEDEDDEQGRQWGAHTFDVRFLAQGVP